MTARRLLHLAERTIGDMRAVRRGRISQRVANRLIGRAVGRALRRVWL